MRMAVAALGMLAVLTAARAEDSYPSRPITLVVPVPPGGAADFIARLVGGKLSEALGQPVVISNRAGASGIIASDSVAKAAPDGYTLLLNSITTHGIGPHLYAHLPYDPVKDFTPIIFARQPAAHHDDQRRASGEIGAGGGRLRQGQSRHAHVSPRPATAARRISPARCSKTSTGTKMLHVPYRGSGPAVIDVAPAGWTSCSTRCPRCWR